MKSPRILLSLTASVMLILTVAWVLPLPSTITGSSTLQSFRIEDRNGVLLSGRNRNGRTDPLPYDRIPGRLIQALIATEDRSYFSNPGINIRGTVRAALRNIREGRVVEGGSGITQQFVRLRLKPERRTLLYKMREAWLALKVRSRISEEEVLSQFLSSAFFGNHSYGIEAAARTYFDVSVESLSLSQSALLVGLLNAPSSLNPFRYPQHAIARRDLVLRAMHHTGVISDDEYRDAGSESISFHPEEAPVLAPHFVQMVSAAHPEQSATLRTTLDAGLQSEVEGIVRRNIDALEDKNVSSAAVVVLDAHTGDILALVGSKDFFDTEHDGQVNVALSPRQPGSTLKPFTYALALEQGTTAATTIADTFVQYSTKEGTPYTPRNYDFDEHGLVRVREALANSYNIAAVKTLELVGVEKLLQLLRSIGISTLTKEPEHYGLALTLGSGEVQLLELASAYTVFPNLGIAISPRMLLADTVQKRQTSIQPTTAWIITNILSDPSARLPEFGSDSPLNFDVPVAVKTGTTRNSRDNWTMGYTQDTVVGVWVGNADNAPMRGTSGVTGAAPIFHDVMTAVMNRSAQSPFLWPGGIESVRICKLSGLLPTDLCTETMDEVFAEGTAPKAYDTLYESIDIDMRNNLRAFDGCEARFTVKKTFVRYPLELQRWARDRGIPLPPSKYSPLCPAQNNEGESATRSSLRITHPHDGSSFLLDPTIPNTSEHIIFRAEADPSVSQISWYVDDQFIATADAPEFVLRWSPFVGSHTIEARYGEESSKVRISVHRE